MAKAAGTTPKDLRGMTETDLRAQVGKLRQEMWQGRIKLREGAVQQSHQIRQARRQIARIMTVLKEQAAKAPTERS